MGMHPQLGAMKDRDKRRRDFILEIGCVCCIEINGAASPGGQGHHAEDDNDVVIGHHALICFCDWHHNGNPPPGKNKRTALETLGPSRHRHRPAFRERFGTDLQLLEKQNALLETFLSSFVIRPSI